MPKFLTQKGIAPVVLVIIAGVVIAGWFGVSRGFFNFGSKTSSLNELDCFQLMVDVTKANPGELEWGKILSDVTSYPTEKKTLLKKDGDYCQTQRIQKDGTNNPVETVRITYFDDASEAVKKVSEFKSKEDSSFKVSQEEESFYVGSAAKNNNDNFGFNYARAFKASGNCLIEYKYSQDRLLDSSADPEGEFIKLPEISAKSILDGINKDGSYIDFCIGSSNTTSSGDKNTSDNRGDQNSGGLDCLATVTEATDPSSTWKSSGNVTSEKETVGKIDNDYCLIKHQSKVSDYGAGLGQVDDPSVNWNVKITYLKDRANPDQAFDKLDKLKKSEKPDFQTSSDSLLGYVGQTADLSGLNYIHSVVFQGHCFLEQTVENDLSLLVKGNGVFKWDLDKIKTHMGMMGGWVDGLQYNLSGNQKFTDFCN